MDPEMSRISTTGRSRTRRRRQYSRAGSPAREAWKLLGVNGLGVAYDPPAADFPLDQMPKLTTRMEARIQGFPDSWEFSGRKNTAYRQVGNAFPPPVARALGDAIRRALETASPAPGATDLGHHASLAVAAD